MNTTTLVGIDTGGTFTDIVVLDEDTPGGSMRQCKVLSDPSDPSAPIVRGLRQLGLEGRRLQIIHGTTVGTNAVLEGKGARVAYVTSEGFADVLTLGRQNREEVYQLRQPELPPPVEAELCFEVRTRIGAGGEVLDLATATELVNLRERLEPLGVEAVAVNLPFSFLRPGEEQRIARALEGPWFIALSSAVLPEVGEYERGIATWLNASVGPVIARYLDRLQERLPRSRIAVMQSMGTTIAADQAAGHAVHLLLSGPAGGLAAAECIGRQSGSPKLMSFDMGGTSTDVALLNGEIPLTGRYRLGRWPVSTASVDVHTIGAGGGSIAKVDAAGMLLVGPQSAGASPGPACYGQGGLSATVTDANLVLGRIPANTLLGGYLPLDLGAAETAIAALAAGMDCEPLEAARGVITIANEHMARALRVISVERGHDPAGYGLLCFGGAGGLHACDLAELLNMSDVIIPARAGVLSALGMLVSRPGRELSAAVLELIDELTDADIGRCFEGLENTAAEQLTAEGCRPGGLQFRHRLEMRYRGQSATVAIDWQAGADHAEAFHQAHARLSGVRLPHPVEVVNVRLGAHGPAALETPRPGISADGSGPGEMLHMAELAREVEVRARDGLAPGEVMAGPVILTEKAMTAWIKPGWQVTADEWGNLRLRRAR